MNAREAVVWCEHDWSSLSHEQGHSFGAVHPVDWITKIFGKEEGLSKARIGQASPFFIANLSRFPHHLHFLKNSLHIGFHDAVGDLQWLATYFCIMSSIIACLSAQPTNSHPPTVGSYPRGAGLIVLLRSTAQIVVSHDQGRATQSHHSIPCFNIGGRQCVCPEGHNR